MLYERNESGIIINHRFLTKPFGNKVGFAHVNKEIRETFYLNDPFAFNDIIAHISTHQSKSVISNRALNSSSMAICYL